MCVRNSSRKVCGSDGIFSCVKNSPGILSVVPYRNSAVDALMSSFRHVLSPNKTVGKISVQRGDWWHRIAVFRVRCHLSISPLDSGWYAVVRMRLLPMTCVRALKRIDSNCDPWSVVMNLGQPNRDIQLLKKVFAIVAADVSLIGMASGHLENLSIIVRQYLLPSDSGSGPTMSMCTWSKRRSGSLNMAGCVCTCRPIFDRW